MFYRIAILLAAALPAVPLWGRASYYTLRLDDPKAVYLTRENFPVRGDGTADDSDAVQHAIDKVQETTSQGIVFVPEGRYRISRTIYIWPGVRLIGYGASRPVLLLGASTPGFQDADEERQMLFFAGGRPGYGRGGARGATGGPPPDANPGTFYSAVSNIDVEVGDGNPGAVAFRAHYAQHCFLAHMDIWIGSGIAGIHEGGNVVEDVAFHGGRYGIWTRRPSPGWQLTVIDCFFEGQREAAIQEREAGLTLVRPQFRKVPAAISIDPGYAEELWVKDAQMIDIPGPAVAISLEANARTQINIENVFCRNVPVFALLRESGKKMAAPGPMYDVNVFSHGLHYADMGAAPETKDVFEAAARTTVRAPALSDLPDLPPRDQWANIHALGAKGDGWTDDTAAFRRAIAAHRAIYIPSGYYTISDTLELKPDTVLIGLHPSATELVLNDRTPAFQGVGSPKAMIEAPRGGTNVVVGIGLYTNGINPRAVAAKWMAGRDSMMNDVRFLGGHGTNRPDGSRENPYNNTHTADPDLNRRWDGQYPSLWVTAGGGGTFLDIWTPSTFAQAGMLVSDTSTEGRIYEMSSEHHVRYEVQLHNVSNWKVYALQTEEERGEGGFALPLEIANSSAITVANMCIYRVISTFQPFPWAIRVSNSRDIRFRNVHSYSNSKVAFDDTVYDQTHDRRIRQREFAWLNVSGNAPAPPRPGGTKVEKLASGFYNISGGAVDRAGDFYFVDAHWQRIYRWSASSRRISTVSDSPLDPVNLAFDKAGNLLVVSYAGNGTVYSLKPGAPEGEVEVLKAQPVTPRPGLTAVLPVGDWHIDPERWPKPEAQYVSPDGSVFIPAARDFVSGAMSWGVKSSALLRSFGLAAATAGKPFYLTSEANLTTWSATVAEDGGIAGMKLFANQGGEGVAVDRRGNVYVAAGEIYVYDPAGKLLETIEVPERPIQLAFGGPDGNTLYVAARTSLYAARGRGMMSPAVR